jgi:hypothetical protein
MDRRFEPDQRYRTLKEVGLSGRLFSLSADFLRNRSAFFT